MVWQLCWWIKCTQCSRTVKASIEIAALFTFVLSEKHFHPGHSQTLAMRLHLAAILILCIEHVTKAVAQGMPISPCPKVFQYRFDGSEWFGLMAVRSPDGHQPLHIRVTLSMRGKPTTVSGILSSRCYLIPLVHTELSGRNRATHTRQVYPQCTGAV